MDGSLKELKKTSKAGFPLHYHIVYLNDEGPVGATSVAAGHEHRLMYDPPRPPRPPSPAVPPQIDPMTGQPVINPETGEPDMGQPEDPGDPGKEVGEWVMEPGEDGHTHEIVEYKVKKKKESKETEQDIISDILQLWSSARGRTAESRKLGLESEQFYSGKGQWSENAKRTLETLDRACLTINEIGKNVDELLGTQMKERTDFSFLPVEGGDQKVADMLNVLCKQILDGCYYPREESKVFRDVTIPGMGVFHVYMDFERDIRGEIKVERYQWDEIDYGPHEKEDLADCEFEVRSKMYSIAKLRQLYPKKADKITESLRGYQLVPEKTEKVVGGGTNTDYRYAKTIQGLPQTLDGELKLVDIAAKELRQVQCTRKTYQPVTVIFNHEEGFFFSAFDWDEKDIEAASSLPGFQSITQIKTRMRVTRFCGNVLLSDENPVQGPIQDFTTIPVYAYRMRDDFWGKVEVAKDPQREINKRRSQTIDILNRMTSYLRYYDSETFEDPKDLKQFREKSAQPGSLHKVANADRPPRKEEGAEFPNGLVQMMQDDRNALTRLMNITVEQGGANEPGSIFLAKKEAKLAGNEFLFDNFSFAKQKLGKILVQLIQRYYDAERIYRILNTANSRQPINVGEKPFVEYERQEIIDMIENADLTSYDVVVAESAFSPSMRLKVATALFELMKNGSQIPPELPLEFIDMPENIRNRITQTTQEQSQMQAQQMQETSNTEIVKTLIAKGQYTVTPEKAQELGLIPAGQPMGENPVAMEGDISQDGNIQEDQTPYAENLVSSLAG